MPQTSSPYAGQPVALVTRHGKQRVIGRALRHGLGAELLHLPEIDTDALGSFCGTVPRQGSALEACLAKAELALAHAGTALAIASEGSFGPHPAVPLLPVGVELMVFLDRERGLTIHEQLQARRTNFAQRLAAAGDLVDDAPGPDLMRWLQAVGFPSHALIVRSHRPIAGGVAAWPASAPVIGTSPGAGEQPQDGPLRKGIRDRHQLLEALRLAMASSSDGCASIETDMRAHCNPTRMASIRQLSFRLVRRLASPCPACAAPGWGQIASQAGLPCAWCAAPTPLIRTELYGCVRCDHRQELPRRDGQQQADPGHCPFCNP